MKTMKGDTMLIATHTSPDLDAIGSAWLVKRYLLPEADITYVNTGNPDAAVLARADAVVDTGKVADAATLRFDHHQFDAANSATRLVYEYLALRGDDVAHLAPLVALIHAGDNGHSLDGADWSRLVGIHAIISSARAARMPDADIMALGMQLLDAIERNLKRRVDAKTVLDRSIVYRAADGLVVAIRNAPQGVTFAAFEDGARLVLFASDNVPTADGGVTQSIGIQRNAEWATPHVGQLVESLVSAPTLPAAMRDELALWFRHPVGFFAGRGTLKAPCDAPIMIDVAALAARLDSVWVRD